MTSAIISCYVATEINVVIHVTKKVSTEAVGCGTTKITNELSLGHLVLDMRTGQVNA